MIMMAARLNGKKLFQVKYIRLSYRIRGRVARTHTNRVAKIIVFKIKIKLIINENELMNKTLVISLIIKMLAYSAIKIKAKDPALYSTLNPDTNSDSPSAKSNGVRLVSAKFVTNHIKNKGLIIKIIHEFEKLFI